MSTNDLIIMLLLDAFFAAGTAGAGLTLQGNASAAVLEMWARIRGLPIERTKRSRVDCGRTVTWDSVTVTLRELVWLTAICDDDVPDLQLSFDATTRAVTGFDYTDVNAKLDAETSAFPNPDEVKP